MSESEKKFYAGEISDECLHAQADAGEISLPETNRLGTNPVRGPLDFYAASREEGAGVYLVQTRQSRYGIEAPQIVATWN